MVFIKLLPAFSDGLLKGDPTVPRTGVKPSRVAPLKDLCHAIYYLLERFMDIRIIYNVICHKNHTNILGEQYNTATELEIKNPHFYGIFPYSSNLATKMDDMRHLID